MVLRVSCSFPSELLVHNSFKGIVLWDWDWLEWIVNEKNLGLPEHIFIAFWRHFHVLICKKQALLVSHLTVTLRMMSNNPQIGLIHQFCTCTIDSLRGKLLPRWRNWLWRYLQDDCRHFLKSFAVGTVLSACFFYRQVIIDDRCRSAVVTHHSQSNCLMIILCGLIF